MGRCGDNERNLIKLSISLITEILSEGEGKQHGIIRVGTVVAAIGSVY